MATTLPVPEPELTKTNRQACRPNRRRVVATGLVLASVYLIGGLIGNLHLVLVDHHGTFAHAHSQEHHQSTCPDAEWLPSQHCTVHHELADHDVVSANTTRTLQTGSTLAVVPQFAAHHCAGDGDRTVPETTIPTILGRMASSAPVRAPPADLHTV